MVPSTTFGMQLSFIYARKLRDFGLSVVTQILQKELRGKISFGITGQSITRILP